MKTRGDSQKLLAGCLLLASSLSLMGQQAVDDARAIKFDVTLHDRGGKAATFPLPQSDFAITDNKQAVTPLQFRALHKGEESVQVVLVLDTVNIEASQLGQVKHEVAEFLRAQSGALAYPTSITITTDKGFMTIGFSADGNKLAEALEKAAIPIRGRDFQGGTEAVNDRLAVSTQNLMSLGIKAKAWPGRTIVLWVSPGWKYSSDPTDQPEGPSAARLFKTIVDFSTQLRTSHITVYAVDPASPDPRMVGSKTFYLDFLKGVRREGDVQNGDIALQVLAVQSGGRVVVSNDVVGALQDCEADLREYYEITIPAGPVAGRDRYHHLEVKVSEPAMSVQTRDGYYVQPEGKH